MPKFIDIHSHTQFPAYKEDREEVIKRALDNGVWMINVGTNKITSQDAVELAHKYPEGVYAAIGLHPIHTEESHHDVNEGEGYVPETDFDHEFYKKLALDPKVVAIGECGLDFFHLGEESKQKQIDVFKKHIELSVEIDKPLMIHVRDAYGEVLEILEGYKKKFGEKLKGNVHFFAGSLEVAKRFLDLGFTLSFTGVITYSKTKTSPDYAEIIKMAPLNMIMAETDAPYVAPVPFRGKRNESLYVREIVKKIAEIKDLGQEDTALEIVKNSMRIFGLDR